ncbi:MAG: bifunctional lysylphosphatidylglycerol synthetase/lysine--tRNA ligase LysX [Micropruina sp.]|uniref:bifunctional lysylphosphatidylglycerol synthetase/lysine--tRNA ligase LysX n=1 Tax=Micropruina sp. TaxID=2737536 RepID=UPI0039E42F9B
MRGARWLTGGYAAATVIAAASWLFGRWGHQRFHWLEEIVTLVNIPLSRTIASVALLALITVALVLRKRVALIAVMVCQLFGMYLGLSLVINAPVSPWMRPWRLEHTLAGWFDIASVPLGAAALVWLWTLRPAFPARLRRGSLLRAGLVALAGLVLSVGVSYLLAGTYASGSGTPWDGVLALFARLFGDTGPLNRAVLAAMPRWVPEVTSLALTVTMLATVVTFLRTASNPTGWSGERELAIRRLVRDYGAADSLAYFATRRDKSSIFSPDGRAVITYQLIAGVSLASGDPVGDRDSWPAAIEAWYGELREYGWIPAVLGASADGARAYARAGLRVLPLGDEAVLDARRFAPASGVRRAAQRARRAGVTVRIARQAELDAETVTELYALADSWRHGSTERGYSMALNRAGDPADGHLLFVIASDAAERPVGLLSFVPWGATGLSLDLMRRSPDAPGGVTELMVTQLMAHAGQRGVQRVSLNFCMFRRVFAQAEEFDTGPRLNASLLGLLDRFWQLERLYRANRLYHPDWVPRVLCFDDRVGLPQVLTAVGAAEGFLPWPGRSGADAGQQLSVAELDQVDALGTAPQLMLQRRRDAQAGHRLEHLTALSGLGLGPTPEADDALSVDVADVEAAPWVAGEQVAFSGRVRAARDHGGVVFADLTGGGVTVQMVLEASELPDSIAAFRRYVDTGDLLAVTGVRGLSRNGTRSVLVRSWRVAAKALHPIPFGGLSDPQARLRRRSADLIVHPEQAPILRNRAAVVSALRGTLAAEGFLEVETPILQVVHGGATARPFTTHSNAYNQDLYLRIAPELYLKRLVVGGMGRLYELGRNFRNEGADATHNPEFTSLEAYQPGGDYRTVQALTERLVRQAAIAVHGRPALPPVESGQDWVDLTPPWRTVPVLRAVSDAVGVQVSLQTPVRTLYQLARERGVPVPENRGAGAVIEELYGELVEPATQLPTFYVDFPEETSPLTAAHRNTPGLVERWDLVIRGMELATGYSELTDPVDQRDRLTRQSLLAAGGDAEAMELDQDFLAALELGMPPTGGLGIGVDRLVMLLTGLNIRSVLSFPFVRPPRAH